ncbi:MAG TPA: hypothetical protein VEA69_16645 [Tepidisphaeraceae bacterium]|nr:hypothetical protein [Tepidisphaeraceae bacterium]
MAVLNPRPDRLATAIAVLLSFGGSLGIPVGLWLVCVHAPPWAYYTACAAVAAVPLGLIAYALTRKGH